MANPTINNDGGGIINNAGLVNVAFDATQRYPYLYLYVNLPFNNWGCAKKRTRVKRDSESQSRYEYTCDPREEEPEEV